MTSGMQYGENTVSAELNVSVPAEAIETLGELIRRTEQFRVQSEAAARAQGSLSETYEELPKKQEEATRAQERYLEVLQATVAAQRELSTGRRDTSNGTAAPRGYQDPFEGMQQGLGVNRSASAESVAGILEQLQHQDPRLWMNMQAQRGNIQPGDITPGSSEDRRLDELADRIARRNRGEGSRNGQGQADPVPEPDDEPNNPNRWSRFLNTAPGYGADAQQILNELRPNGAGGHFGALGLASRMASRAGAAASGAGGAAGALGSVARVAGPVGAALAGGLALNSAVQNAGEFYQSYKNQGMERGGGFSEGFGYEMQARTMAINPFISTDQARQIMQSALKDGYTGKEFDTVTDFMAKNLKDMNMSIANSAALMRKNVIAGGQSIQGLNASLATMKELSKDGYAGLSQRQENFTSGTAALISQGMSGGDAAAVQQGVEEQFSDNPVLAQGGVSKEFVESAMQNDLFMIQVGAMSGVRGVNAGEISEQLGDKAGSAVWKKLRDFALRASKAPTEARAVTQFQMYIKPYFPKIAADRTQSRALMKELLANPEYKGDREVKDAASDIHNKGAGDYIGDVGKMFGGIGASVTDALWNVTGGLLADTFSGNFGNMGKRLEGVGERADKRAQESKGRTGTNFEGPVWDQLTQMNQREPLEFVMPDGSTKDFEDLHEQELIDFKEGRIKWRKKGDRGGGYTIDQTTGSYQGGQDSSSETVGSKEVPGGGTWQPGRGYVGGDKPSQVTGQLTVVVDDRRVHVDSHVPLSPNQEAANQGWGRSTHNNPPPGDRPR